MRTNIVAGRVNDDDDKNKPASWNARRSN